MQLRLRVIAAIVAGVLALYLLYTREKELEKRAFGGARISVIVAKNAIKAGGRLKEQDVETQDIPEVYLHPQAIRQTDAGQVLGRQLALAVNQGQPIQWTDFGTSEGGRPGSAVPKGLRGTAISVNEFIGKSGLVTAGDRVDVLGTFGLSSSNEIQGSLTVTLLQNVPLIEINGTTAMLALELEEAELMTFAAAKGQVSLLLRNAEDLDVKKDIPPKSFKSLVAQIRELEAITAAPASLVGSGGDRKAPNPNAVLKNIQDSLNAQSGKRPRPR